MKLTYEDKLKIYDLWKNKHYSCKRIAKEFRINHANIHYMVRLMDMHGIDIVYHGKNRYYSPDFKLAAIHRLLRHQESAFSISLELGLSNHGLLHIWMKSFKENGYTIIERRKGRKPHDKEESKKGKRRTGEREYSFTPTELETDHRERILKKIRCLGSTKKKPTKEEIVCVIGELRQELSCSLVYILHVIHTNPQLPQITRSDYYYHVNKDHKDKKNDDIMNQIITIFYKHKQRYGYRRITLALINMGYCVNHKKVKRLMSTMGLYAKTPKVKYKSYKGDCNGIVQNQLLRKVVDEKNHKTYFQRDFLTTGCNQKWTTDVTEFQLADGKVYLSPIMDMHNREIISFDISSSPSFRQTVHMLDDACKKYHNLDGLILHSDQGWQYQMIQYRKILEKKRIIQSMSRKGNCLDNSPMENFFGRMKNEMFYGHEYEYKTKEELIQGIKEYIHYYNNERIQVKLKGLTFIQYRKQSL